MWQDIFTLKSSTMSVLLETSVGDIVIDLYTDRAPQTTLNFLKLCKIKYYNFCSFFNVQKDFMVQTGDPNETGKGGESIFGIIEGPHKKYFPAEIHPKLKHKNIGTVSMSVAQGQNTTISGVGSQFFITTANNLDYLDGKHAVFGEVAEGLDILEKINSALCDEKGRPFRDIRIKHTIILDDPFPDPSGIEDHIPDASPLPTREQLQSITLAEDEPLETDEDPETLDKRRREKEARAQALTLEMVGDLPFAEVRPPENVLFVCKLNPITRDEDLELIFSRFGTIISCEIIRDKKTSDSLCYAFVEFDKKEQCEEAFFKMDNCLIDDRRIHVDFSQSVSKLHRDWVARRTGGSRDFGGEGLQRRTKYREGGSIQRGDEYDLVFDHGGDFETEQKQHSGSGRSDRKLQKTRKRSRSRSSSKERSPPRRRDDRDRDRDRERDRDRDKQGERDRDYYYRKNERRRERSRSREQNRRDRSRSRDQNRRSRR